MSNISRKKSEALFEKAKTYFPGGVNSPVRAFKAVEGSPLFIKKGDGAYIWDEDDNQFIDFCGSWGPLILGHNHPDIKKAIVDAVENGTTFGAPTVKENQLAELILANNKFIERIRFVSSGTEAVMSAIRLARGYTGRNKILKFDGCYHGHADSLLVNAGSGLATLGTSSSAGVPESFSAETIVVPLNNENAVKEAITLYGNDIAGIIIEPIPANNGLLLQRTNFLEFLRAVCTENGILLIFDEVISGFRVGFEGAAGLFNIKPDIITYGKIIGGGMPVGAYGASEDIMNHIAPLGNVYQAGTLSGNPVAMAAGYAQLKQCVKKTFYESQEKRTNYFVESINEYCESMHYKFKIVSIGSIFWLSFADNLTIRESAQIDPENMKTFKRLYADLLNQGIYLGPSGYEVGFISQAHSKAILKEAIAKFIKALDETFGQKELSFF